MVRLRPDDAPLSFAASPKARSLHAHVTEPCRIDHGEHEPNLVVVAVVVVVVECLVLLEEAATCLKYHPL